MTGRPVPSTTDAPPADAVPARPASTVLIVRDGAEGVEVFMMRRQLTMAFAAGALVFPGGGVDPQDADSSLPWHGPSPAELGRAMGLPAARAREHVCAAVRETFEECGVLLATPRDRSARPGTTTEPGLAADRGRLLTREITLAQLLTSRGLVLRADLLRPWAHWVTPADYPRRYDTRFFLARLPHGQEAMHLGGESAESRWWSPAEALARGRRGEVLLLDPTRSCLEDLAAAPSVDALLAPPGRA